jgi:hypothetical protein
MKFCSKCGASLQVPVQPPTLREPMKDVKKANVLNALSVGAILIILAVTYLRYPIDASIISHYFESMSSQGMFIKPPSILFDLVIFFLSALGVWTITFSGLRVIIQKTVKTSLTDLFGGLFCLFTAFLISNYANDVLTERMTLAYIVITLGFLVILNTIIRFAFSKKSRYMHHGMGYDHKVPVTSDNTYNIPQVINLHSEISYELDQTYICFLHNFNLIIHC